MSENQNGRVQKLSEYDEMATEQLEEILRLDAQAPEGQESDVDTLLYIMGVLADRRKKEGHAGKTALEAYESFKLYYLPEVENIAEETEMKATPRKIPSKLLRGLSAAAAVVLVLVLGTVTAKAFGVDIWETIAKWTQETFHFSSSENEEYPDAGEELPYSSLIEALKAGNIEENLVPTWLPDGYELKDVIVEETPTQNIYYAIYQNGECIIKINVRNYLNDYPQYVEQGEGLLETYEASGVVYYLIQNYDNSRAEWITHSYECYISGDLTIEQLKLMIDSIEKG